MNSSASSTVTAPGPPTRLPRRSVARAIRNSDEGQDELDESPGARQRPRLVRLGLSTMSFQRPQLNGCDPHLSRPFQPFISPVRRWGVVLNWQRGVYDEPE